MFQSRDILNYVNVGNFLPPGPIKSLIKTFLVKIWKNPGKLPWSTYMGYHVPKIKTIAMFMSTQSLFKIARLSKIYYVKIHDSILHFTGNTTDHPNHLITSWLMHCWVDRWSSGHKTVRGRVSIERGPTHDIHTNKITYAVSELMFHINCNFT